MPQNWRRCWAELKQHEGHDLDTDELQEAQRKQADIRSFQLEMQKRKKQQIGRASCRERV